MSEASAVRRRGEDRRWEITAAGVGLGAVVAAGALAIASETFLRSDAGAAALLTVTIALIVALIALDIPVATDTVSGNTFSELLREGAGQTTIIPWSFAVFAGRWFHPVDGFNAFGVWGGVALMALSWVVVLAVAIIRRRSSAEVPVPVWTIVAAGLVAGAVLWPVG